MEKNIVIGIEGMVASGKTSICKELIQLIPNSIFIDAGEIYRGIIDAIRKENINISDLAGNVDPMDLMKKLQVEFKIENNVTQIYIKGKKIESEKIETMENSVGVSQMAMASNNENLYKFAKRVIDTYREKFNIILSARDLITIYPDMTYHIFVTADIEERIKRRYNQYRGKYSLEQIKNIIQIRDTLHENAGFNKLYDRSIKIDVTDCKNAKESAKKVINSIGGLKNELCK